MTEFFYGIADFFHFAGIMIINTLGFTIDNTQLLFGFITELLKYPKNTIGVLVFNFF